MRSVGLNNEKGVALVATILIGAVMLLMVGGLTAYGIKSQNISRRDQDWNAALAAAEAGVDDYIYRLNQNTTYYTYSASTPPPDGNQGFTQWVPLRPGAGEEGEFRYTPDASDFLTTGIIELTSSGRVNGEVRTIHTLLRRRGFIDFLYFTIFETKDPARYTGVGEFTVAQADLQCGEKYFYAPDARDSTTSDGDPACSDINFISADDINGPMHTNDAMLVCGSPRFRGETTTAWAGTGSPVRYWRGNGSCSNDPDFDLPGFPRQDLELNFPASNSALRAAADPALGGDGCVYTGPTSIRLQSDGQMVVNSPFTRVRTQPACAGPATRSATFTPAPPQTVNMPPNGVVYVQGVPGNSSDPNFTSAAEMNTRCPTTSVPTGSGNVSVRQNPLGYPRILTPSGSPTGYDITPGYGCSDGDAFVAGTLNGQLTIGASDSIIAAAYNSSNSTTTSAANMDNGHGSEDILYNSTAGNTILGLVANAFVEVYHPMEDDGDEMLNDDNITIYSAMLSVLHSFVVQNYQRGEAHGQLSVFGAIAQRYRGPVGTFGGSGVSTGYAKNYDYDTRLRFLSPPSWVSPVESQWRVKTFSELQPAY